MDAAVTRWLNAPAGGYPVLDTLMVGFTQLGVPLMVVLVAVQWWVRADRTHVRHAALAAGMSFLLGLVLNQFILEFVHRIRPYDAGISHLIIAPSADWSFPSDHATASVAIVVAFALQRLPRRTLGLSILAFLICWSRVYVGTHYIGEVLGGMLTGAVAAVAVRLGFREGTRLDRFATGLF